MSETTTHDGLTITEIGVPADASDLASAAYTDFQVSVDVRDRVDATIRGDDSVAVTAEQVLPMWKSTEEEVHGWILRTQDDVAGRAMLYVFLEEGSRRAQVRVEVLPESGAGESEGRLSPFSRSGHTSEAAASCSPGPSMRRTPARPSPRGRDSARSLGTLR